MDPIYYQVNQTRLTEFSQKNTTDTLRTQHSKDMKKKAERTGELDSGMLESDVRTMSDDMLGDMDPDDRSGGSGQQFAQMWREQMSGEEQRKRQQPPPPPPEEEAPSAEPVDAATSDEQAAPPPAVDRAPEAPPAPEKSAATPPPAGPRALGRGGSEEAAEPAASRPSPETGSPPAAESRSSNDGPPTPSPKNDNDSPPPSQEKARASSADDRAQVSAPKAAPVEAQAARRRSEVSSLLDFSSGFLIAEEAGWGAGGDEEALPEEQEGAQPALPEQLSALLDRLVTGDAAHPSYRKLQNLLARFGARVLQLCAEAGVRVYLMPPGEPLGSHPQLDEELEGAAYLPEQRLCLVDDRCVREAPAGFHPVFYYFAHAFDHALGGERFASLKSAAVQASFAVCDTGDHRFGDLMAAHSPIHYFAQAVESYLSDNDCFEPLWTRSDLYDFDRSMHDYVEYLLRP